MINVVFDNMLLQTHLAFKIPKKPQLSVNKETKSKPKSTKRK